MNFNNEEKKLSVQDFINRPYPVILGSICEQFYIYVPKLQIYVERATMQGAYDLYQKEKANFYNRLEAIGALHLIPPLNETLGLRKRIDLQKLLIDRGASFVLTVLFWVLLLGILGHKLNKASSKINEAFVPVSVERSDARLERFKVKLDIVAPYLREIKKAINE